MNKIGIIAGSGFYNLESIKIIAELEINTPFGKPSDKIMHCELDGIEVFFIARHSSKHEFLPHEVNYRANIYALKTLGVTKCLGISAVGSLKEELKPGDFVMPDQLIDKTNSRASTFFESPYVAHVSLANPFCNTLRSAVFDEIKNEGAHFDGTYICMQGPAFSTKAESNLHRQMGGSLIGMTMCPEAKLAREAQIAYISICIVSDYDCWKDDQKEVEASDVINTLNTASKKLKERIPAILKTISKTETSKYTRAVLCNALMCNTETFNKRLKEIHSVLSL